MVSRAYGHALSDEEIEDVYSAAWAATLSALRVRGEAMADSELRAYVLTAVASHASKELRRRARKPAGPMDSTHEQVISDVHVPLPEEAAIGAESAEVARDVLASLPPRRRAVMLLRYGWGLAPKEVCALVSGLSPRAYRKEVTRGVQQLIERLREVESGEWCESRERLLRSYIAGTASEQECLQVERHLGHCRACSKLATRLMGQLHDAGAGFALGSVAGLLGGGSLGIGAKVLGGIDAAKAALGAATDRVESAASSLASTVSPPASGAAGAGLAAKVAAGGGGKAVLACLGTGAAATACVAAGVVPGVDVRGGDGPNPAPTPRPAAIERGAISRPVVDARITEDVVQVGEAVASTENGKTAHPGKKAARPPVASPAPVSTPDLTTQEFDPVVETARATETAAPPQPAPAPAPAAPAVSSGGDEDASGGSGGRGVEGGGEPTGPARTGDDLVPLTGAAEEQVGLVSLRIDRRR